MNYTNAPVYPVYQQAYPQPYQDQLAQLRNQYNQMMPTQGQNMTQVQQINQGLLWVQGESGAKSYLVAPNTTVLLMDSEGSRFYLKSTDNAGMPNLRTFEYAEVHANAPQAQQTALDNLDDKYVTREEYNNLKAQYMDMMNTLNSFRTAPMDDETSKRPAARGNAGRNKGGNDNE